MYLNIYIDTMFIYTDIKIYMYTYSFIIFLLFSVTLLKL